MDDAVYDDAFSVDKLFVAEHFQCPAAMQVSPQYMTVSNNPGSANGYSTIASALAAAAALAPAVCVIDVLPGNPYVETCPLVVPDKCTVTGESNLSVVVVPTVATAHVFELGDGASIENMHITGASGAGGVAVYKDCTTGPLLSPVKDVLITNCETGAIGTGAGSGVLLIIEVRIACTAAASIVTGVRAEAGAQVRAVNVIVAGNPIRKVTTGLLGTGANSQMRARGCFVTHCTDGMLVTDGARGEGTVVVSSLCGSAFVVEGSDAATQLTCTETTVSDSTLADVDVRATAASTITFGFCNIQWPKVLNPNYLKISGVTFGTTAGDVGMQIAGELSVGTSEYPAETAMGSGASFVHEMAVFTNSNGTAGTWADVTTEAASYGGSTFALPGAGVGNTLYIGSPAAMTGGFFLAMNTPVGAGESANLAVEYWTGAAWVAVATMSCKSTAPYTSYATALFERAGDEHVRIGKITDWAAQSLNGSVALYWLRVRVATALAAAPVFDQIKIHPHSFAVSADGFTQFFGCGRQVRKLPWQFSDSSPGVHAPANQDLYLGKTLEVGRGLNYYTKGDTDRIGILEPIPPDIDTSCPLKLQLGWMTTGAGSGNIRWVFRWARLGDAGAVYATEALAPSAAVGGQSAVVLSAAPTAASQFRIDAPVYLDISAVNARPASGLGDYLCLTIERDSTHGDDTYTGNIALVSMQVQYVAAFSGAHLQSF